MQSQPPFGRLPSLAFHRAPDTGATRTDGGESPECGPSPEVAAAPPPQPQPAEERPKEASYRWILHPVADLLFVCGGLVWIFGLLMWMGFIPNAPSSPFMTAASITALILFAMPHQTATYLRVYDSKSTSKTLGRIVAFFAGVCVLLGGLAMVSPYWASIVGRITLGFSFQHFYAQAYGIVLLYCYKRGFFLNKLEKNTLHCLTYAGICSAVTNVFSRANLNVAGFELIPVVALPLIVRTLCDVAVAGLALAFTALMVKRWVKTRQVIPWPAVLSLVSCFLFLGYLERYASFLAIAILGQGLFHSPQYLVVTLSYHIKERMPVTVPYAKVWTQVWRPVGLKYLGFVLGAGWILSTVITPYLQDYLNSYATLPAMGACAWYCAINLHHYIADACIWKMRDKKTLATLVA